MKISPRLDYESIVRGRAEVVHLAIQFQAAKREDDARGKPIAFCVVIDNSGSMQGLPLEYAKRAGQLVVKHTRPDDLISVVVFSDMARAIVPLQPAKDKPKLAALVAEIRAEGSTNLTAGWMLGRDEVGKASADFPRKILLLSDGQLNVGIVEPAQVRTIVGAGLEMERVRTSCLGFGDNYNEDLLDALAKAGGGTLHDADSPEKFPAIFQQELEAMLRLSVQNVRVRVKKLHYCSGIEVLSDYPMVALPEGGMEITLGDLVSEEERVMVMALEVLSIPVLPDHSVVASLEGEALLDVEIVYDELLKDGVVSKKEQHTIRVLPVQSEAEVKVNETVVEWVAVQMAGKTIAEAIPDQDSGLTASVEQRIASAKEKLARYNRPEQTRSASQQLDDFEERSRDWSARSRKLSRLSAGASQRASSYFMVGRNDLSLFDLYEAARKGGVLEADYLSPQPLQREPMKVENLAVNPEEFAAGCLLGAGVGNALGRVREGKKPGAPWTTEFEEGPSPRGIITGDMQLVLWLMASLVRGCQVNPTEIRDRFTVQPIRGIGGGMEQFVNNVKAGKGEWWANGARSADNSVAVRSAPLGVFFAMHPAQVRMGAIIQGLITHRDPMAIAGGIVMSFAAAALKYKNAPELATIEQRKAFSVELAEKIHGIESTRVYVTQTTNEPASLEQRFRDDVPRWLEENLDPLAVHEQYGSGSYVLESLPHAVYCFLRSPGDFRETMLQAVNTSDDPDSVAAMACALSGTLNGFAAVNQALLAELEFRKDFQELAALMSVL